MHWCHKPTSGLTSRLFTARVQLGHRVITRVSLSFPALCLSLQQIDRALSDIPALATEVTTLRVSLASVRLERANLAAAARATIAAEASGETDPLAYLRDELTAHGHGMERGQP
jgi:hypothetical protein